MARRAVGGFELFGLGQGGGAEPFEVFGCACIGTLGRGEEAGGQCAGKGRQETPAGEHPGMVQECRRAL